jgi:hypothetical protein
MKRFKILFNIGFAVMLTCTVSCKKYLNDNINKGTVPDNVEWATEGNADLYLNGIYGANYNTTNSPDPLDSFTDDNDGGIYWTSYHWKAANSGPSVDGGTQFNTFGNNYADWVANYTRIRRCNVFLAKMDQYKANFSAAYIAKRSDEVRFLRAFTYATMWQFFGGVPIWITVPDNNSMSADQLQLPRSTFEQTFTFIDSELDAVIKNGNLAVKYNHGDANAGRATLGAALMLKGWVELYAASPLFNSGTWPIADPNNLVHFATADPSRWTKAAATFQQFMTSYTQYSLFPQYDQFYYENNEYNSEIIWDKNLVANVPGPAGGSGLANESSNFDQYGGPVYILGQYYTWGNYDPTQELVDSYRMANGKDITDPTSGYDPQNPYVNREPRFYQSIVFDGATYFQPWMPKSDVIYTRIDKLNPSLNQIDFASADVSNTAYYSKKKLNPNGGAGISSGINYIYYRFAEVLLGYAEAQNESAGPDASVYAAINKVRARGGLPGLPAGLTQAQMRTQIRNERHVEFAFEEKRYYDIIRWGTAKTLLSVDRHSMVITNSSPNDDKGVWVYTPTLLNHPYGFADKQWMVPIPQSVMDANKKLIQNPGY